MASKVALVTASSAGLGAATAKALASAGFRVAINYNSSKDKADAIVQEILQRNNNGVPASEGNSDAPMCIAIRADVSKREDIVQLVEATVQSMGRLDVVVSNQGWTRMRTFTDLEDNVDESDWDMCYNMNVKSHLWLFHAAKPHFSTEGGSFVTVASLAGVIPSGSSIPYAVSKAAQIHLVKALAKISPTIQVNSVAPGIIPTEWTKRFPPENVQKAIDKSVQKRLASVEDVAQQIVVFAKTRSITGQNAVIDAGWSLS